jgi:UDP-2-acetamido-3-amino-2,3-dideoxy-glucuronate N-acetyltransferase
MNNVFVHPTALVETEEIGEGTRVWAYAHVMEGAHIGKNCNIGDHCFIESRVVIGDNVTIKNGNMLFEGVTLHDGVFVGPHVFFTNDLYPRSPRLPEAQLRYRDQTWLLHTLVRQGASLGAGAVLLPNITVGEYAMVGAGAVVTKDILPYALVRGNPARSTGWICQCGQPLTFDDGFSVCPVCGLAFHNDGSSVKLSNDRKR